MTETFKCPACSAPLEFEGKTMQKCRFCGSNVIVPSSVMQNSNVFGRVGALDFGDLSALTGKALKIAEVQKLIQSGNKIHAIKVFRETFGTGLKEAKDAVEAMERGESVDISGMQIQTANVRKHQLTAENLQAVKKAGIAIGGSFLITFIVIALFIIGAIAAIFYFTFSTVNKAVEKSSNPVAISDTKETDSVAQEVLKFGGEGTGAGKFKDNRHVAVDAEGKIYSGDYSGGRIQVFDKNGKFLTQWIADKDLSMRDLKADRRGKIYIAHSRGIFVFDGANGELIQKSENIRAEGLALTLDGKIAATVNKGFTIFDENLKPIREIKDAAENAASTFGFGKIAVDGSGTIYALDRQNGDICKFSAEGKFLNRYKIGSRSPNGIEIDNKGRIFVSDTSEIIAFDADGKLINSFKANQAFGIAFNDAGELFVASRPFVIKYQLRF